MWYVYAMEYCSAIKKNGPMQFAAPWMKLEIITLSEVSQKEKDKYRMIRLTCGIQNMEQMNYPQNGNRLKHREQACDCQGQGDGEGWTESLVLVEANYYISNG